MSVFTSDADKYLKPDTEGGFLTDKTEIESEIINKKLDVIDNLMLGNFSEQGDYQVSKDIIEELIKTPKRMENSFNGIYFFTSLKFFGRFGQLKFSCKFIEEEKGYFAKLYLLEPMIKANGFYVNTNTFLIEKIRGEQNKEFVQKVFEYFHVRLLGDSTTDEKVEFVEEEFPAIYNRKWMLLHLQVKKDMALTQSQKKLFEKKLAILDKTLTKEQMIVIKTEINKISKIFVKEDKSKYKNLNQVLDKVLTSGEVKISAQAKEKINNVQSEYSNFVGNIKSLNEITQLTKPQTEASVPGEAKRSMSGLKHPNDMEYDNFVATRSESEQEKSTNFVATQSELKEVKNDDLEIKTNSINDNFNISRMPMDNWIGEEDSFIK